MIIIVPCYIIILCVIIMHVSLIIHVLFNFSEPSTVAHAEAAVLQRATSVESAPRCSTAAGVG